MIKVICGKKGVGKTRALVESANDIVNSSLGDIVFSSGRRRLMYDLNNRIRLTNLFEFPVDFSSSSTFLGFVCGIISANYDIKAVYIDDLACIIDDVTDGLDEIFDGINKISSKFNIDFYISVEGDPNSMPDYVRAYY